MAKKILVIIESSGKKEKLNSILGSNYVVESSLGHIMDLHPNKMSIDFDNNFEPEYHIIDKSKKKVKELISLAKKCKNVIIASDKDREGEMIGWSYQQLLKLGDKYDRLVFNSVTKDEIIKAMNNLTKLDMLYVDSQKARRILDRIVGYKISPVLTNILGIKGMSAGRVQSVVLRLVCDREEEIKNDISSSKNSYFKINALTNIHKYNLFDKDLKNDKIETYELTEKIMKNLVKSKFYVKSVNSKEGLRKSSEPYTTYSIQQDVSTKLGYSLKKTNMILQKLYEKGYITYIRTDSTSLSTDILKQCKIYIEDNYGTRYHKQSLDNLLKVSADLKIQGAHEAIRPVDISIKNLDIDNEHNKIYDLIWKRTVASQMEPAQINIYDIIVSISKDKNHYFKTVLEEITFLGYLIIYDVIQEKINIPELNEEILFNEITGSEEYTKSVSRYTESGLLKHMEKLGIGRPATCPEIINTLIKRKYVEIKDVDGTKKQSRIIKIDKKLDITYLTKDIVINNEKNKFCLTDVGVKVNEFMLKYFPDIVSYEMTALMETQLDKIADGKIIWFDCIKDFWQNFNISLKKIVLTEDVNLGKYMDKDIIIKNSKYGRYIAYGTLNISLKGKTIDKSIIIDLIDKKKG